MTNKILNNTDIPKNRKRNKSKLGVFLFLFSFFLLFFVTKGITPYSSELNYLERSTLGVDSGSVVPASCDSGAPHDTEVCGTWQVTSCGNWWACGSASTYTNSYYCSGANTTPGCLSPQPSAVTCSSNHCTSKVAISFAAPVTMPSATIISYTSSQGTYVPYRSITTLSWSSVNASACSLTSSASGVTGSVATTGSYSPPAWNGWGDSTRTYTFSCSSGSSPVSQAITVTFEGKTSAGISPPSSGCFTAGTRLLLGDGTFKNIENVNDKETLMTSSGQHKILKRYSIPFKGYLYAFNGDGNYFVTSSHPFMTTDGWKSIDPIATKRESPNLKVSKLSVGDTLIKEDGSKILLSSFDKKYSETTVYNFQIEGTHDYYANGYWVHNKLGGMLP